MIPAGVDHRETFYETLALQGANTRRMPSARLTLRAATRPTAWRWAVSAGRAPASHSKMPSILSKRDFLFASKDKRLDGVRRKPLRTGTPSFAVRLRASLTRRNHDA